MLRRLALLSFRRQRKMFLLHHSTISGKRLTCTIIGRLSVSYSTFELSSLNRIGWNRTNYLSLIGRLLKPVSCYPRIISKCSRQELNLPPSGCRPDVQPNTPRELKYGCTWIRTKVFDSSGRR